ncbi:MAG: hypothetical protein AAGE52_23735 [Myxococcota bacterium]
MDALSRPWLLARLLSGLVAALLCVAAVYVAVQVLRRWRVGSTNEGQLALERRAELVATLVQAGLLLALMSLVLTVLAADRSADSIRGAMCAWGVFDSTAVGFWPVVTASLAALACSLWLILHRLDLQLFAPDLTRTKFLALFAVVPFVWLDLGVFTRFAAELDFDVVASCCSVGLDGGALGRWGASGSSHGQTFFIAALTLGLLASATLLWTQRKPQRSAAIAGAFLSLAAGAAMLPAVLLYVAPHAYETPHHLCPFCLLHADVGGIGWPLFGALFAATTLGVSAGVIELARRTAGPDAIQTLQRSLGRWGAASWFAVVVLALVPVLRFAWITGGASLLP